MIKIYLPDGSKREVEKGITAADVTKGIAISLLNKAIAVKINGVLKDLNTPILEDCNFEVVTKESKEALAILRHSAAHLMAEAIENLYPGVQFAYGPATEEGFYYDMKLPAPLSENDFPLIEKEMSRIVSLNEKIERKEVSKEEALDIFKDQKYKTVHINELADSGKSLSIYSQGSFKDLCLGPHMKSTKELKAFKILSTSSCYFKGDKNNDALTRVYGTAFFSKAELDDYLRILEERKQADHKKLGAQLNLFMFSDYGPGLPFWLPNGTIVIHELENFIWNLLTREYGYSFLKTPQMLSRELWERSGHWKKYKENMYITKVDGKPFAIKPMNCPGAILVYANAIHSYRELPIRYAEFGLDHRHEASGALNGLFRARSFTQDDAHIFLAFSQIGEEIRRMLKMFDHVYKTFGLSYSIELSTRPEKYVGKISTWDKAEAELKACLEENNLPYEVNEGDGAFYGPKLDFKIKDSLNRVWQCGTIQLDMQLPHRFNLKYIDKDGKMKEPVMLHRAILGSFERFTGIIIENFKGAFPTWLAPKQVKIIPVNSDENVLALANRLNDRLNHYMVRSDIDLRNEKLSYKIHDSQTNKIPYTVVIGSKEAESGDITYRLYHEKDSRTVTFNQFVNIVKEDIKSHNPTRHY